MVSHPSPQWETEADEELLQLPFYGQELDSLVETTTRPNGYSPLNWGLFFIN